MGARWKRDGCYNGNEVQFLDSPRHGRITEIRWPFKPVTGVQLPVVLLLRSYGPVERHQVLSLETGVRVPVGLLSRCHENTPGSELAPGHQKLAHCSVAQLVERLAVNQEDAGSKPAGAAVWHDG